MTEIRSESSLKGYDEKGKLVYEIDFPLVDGFLEITHTFVDDSLRGKGVAGALVEKVKTIASEKGLRIKATCSFAKAYFEKHPSDLYEK
ncbi:MAG: GNAT family N-acetyltransferase [Bacilli bacterium]